MSNKNQILIISPRNELSPNLSDALKGLELDPCHCSLSEAIETLKAPGEIEAAVLTCVDIAQNQIEQTRELLDQLDDLSIGLLMLTEQPGPSETFASNKGQVVRAQASESADMLKGRLATLLELKPILQSLRKHSGQIEHLSQPLTHYMNQVDEEMRLAARLQQDFLPKVLPEMDQMTFATIYRPATWVSGDIYDIMRLDENHIGFYIADAVGHGMPAALLTMFIKRSIVTKHILGHSYELVAPDVVLEKLNADLIEQELSNFQFATCCYGILNINSLELKLASAGHPLPILIDEQAHTRELQVGGSLLGVFPDATYTTETFTLEPEQKLLLFSDGVEVAFVNEGPDQPLRFRQEFGNLSHYNIKAMCEKLLEIINAEEGSLHPRDDVTIVGIELGACK
jgi:sigma-B regulation protein RsbU (phosphoserine phosphatase)